MINFTDWTRACRPFFKKHIKTHTLEDFEVFSETASGGVIVRHDCLIAPGAGGIHDKEGRPIMESYLRRDLPGIMRYPFGDPQTIDPSIYDGALELNTVIVLPCLKFHHFGIMLLETAAWLAELLDPLQRLIEDAGTETILVVTGDNGQVSNTIHSLLKILDLPEERVVCTKQAGTLIKCKKALIPQPTNQLYRRMNPDIRHFVSVKRFVDRFYGLDPQSILEGLNGSNDSSNTLTGKIYLSRSKLPSNVRKLTCEEDIEKHLEGLGWRIVHPETLTIIEQLTILKEALAIAGNIGSAFHLLMYFGLEAKGKAAICLGSEHETRLMGEYSWIYSFITQFRAQGILFWHLSCLELDRSNNDKKLIDVNRYKDLKPMFSVKNITREIDRIANRVIVNSPSGTA